MTSAAVEKLTVAVEAGTDAIASGKNAAINGFQELAKAYQVLATKNAEKLNASIQALAAVKSPAEFIELQQKLIKEGVDTAIRDSSEIAKLTAAVFTASLEPILKQAEKLQGNLMK
jgi:hypothetical protein